jgi:hypothetical protein
LQQAGQGEIEKIGKPSIKNLRQLLAKNCDGQLAIITKQGFEALNKFEVDGKPRLRKPATPSKHDPRNASGDPRVDVAWKTADAIDTQAQAAFDLHYQAARSQWASKVAQTQLGRDQENSNDTNLEPLKGDKNIPAGVLDVHLFPHLDAKGEDVIGAQISGLSEQVRAGLVGKRGSELHLPIVAEGPTGGRRMRIGVTESHEDIVDLTDSHSGGQWLAERGDGSRREGVLRVAKTVLDSPIPEVESG